MLNVLFRYLLRRGGWGRSIPVYACFHFIFSVWFGGEGGWGRSAHDGACFIVYDNVLGGGGATPGCACFVLFAGWLGGGLGRECPGLCMLLCTVWFEAAGGGIIPGLACFFHMVFCGGVGEGGSPLMHVFLVFFAWMGRSGRGGFTCSYIN